MIHARKYKPLMACECTNVALCNSLVTPRMRSAVSLRLLTKKGTKHLLTYLLSPWRRVLLEKLTGSAASQEIPPIFVNRRFIKHLIARYNIQNRRGQSTWWHENQGNDAIQFNHCAIGKWPGVATFNSAQYVSYAWTVAIP